MEVQYNVADQHPLKQGLKPSGAVKLVAGGLIVADQHPLKQGLKHFRRG